MTWVTRGRRSDAAALRQVMFHAIREGAVAYTARQRWAWMPDRRLRKSFVDKVARQKVWVARGVRGPKGFVTLRADGYVDLAFVGPQHQGNGLFRALMTELMIDTGPRSLFTHASLHAQPAFSALGFCVVQHEQIKARGQVLRRALMQLS